MYKDIPYSNKLVKKRQQQRVFNIHKQNLKSMRPFTSNINELIQPNGFVNNKKKQMIQEHRFTQIERENRKLLEKINCIMSKKPSFKESTKKQKSQQKTRMNKSLNQGFRRKQLEDIQIENAKLLRRLQQKKSDYQAQKLKQQWKKQKMVIKNLANYPFIIRDKIYSKSRRKSLTSQSFHTRDIIRNDPNSLQSPIKLVRIRNLNGNNFLITITYNGQKLQILGDNKTTKQIKVIQIPKQEALQFIQFECDGKIEGIFQCLRYEPLDKILYLMGKGVQLDVENQEETDLEQKHQIARQMSNIYEEDVNKEEQSQFQNNLNKSKAFQRTLVRNQGQQQNKNQIQCLEPYLEVQQNKIPKDEKTELKQIIQSKQVGQNEQNQKEQQLKRESKNQSEFLKGQLLEMKNNIQKQIQKDNL